MCVWGGGGGLYEWHMSDEHAAQAVLGVKGGGVPACLPLGVKGGGVPACLPLAKGNGSIPCSETRTLSKI